MHAPQQKALYAQASRKGAYGLHGAYQHIPCLRTERGYASKKNGPAFAEPFEGRDAEPISLDVPEGSFTSQVIAP